MNTFKSPIEAMPPGIARVNGPGVELQAPLVPVVPGQMAEVRSRIDAAAAAHKAELENLRELERAAALNQAPVDQLIEKARLLDETLTIIRAHLAREVRVESEALDSIQSMISNLTPDAINYPLRPKIFSALADARQAIEHLQVWIVGAEKNLAAMDAEVVALARDRNLQHLLPERLSAKAK